MFPSSQNHQGSPAFDCWKPQIDIPRNICHPPALFVLGRCRQWGITNPPWPNAAAVCSFHAHRTLNTSPLSFLGWTDHLPANSLRSPLSPLFLLPPVGRFAKRNHRQGDGGSPCPRGWWWRSWIDAEPTRKMRRRCWRYQISLSGGLKFVTWGIKKDGFYSEF